MHTAYGSNTCSRCGLPAGLASSSERLCSRCQTTIAHAMQTIVRPYIMTINPNVSPTCPRDALYKYADAAFTAAGYTPDPWFAAHS